jgi:hypothetical protein
MFRRGRWPGAAGTMDHSEEPMMRHIPLAFAVFLALAAPGARAADPAIEALLKAAEIPFEVDKDGDYKIVYDWSKDKRSQLVYISGTTEEIAGMRLYEIFSPAKVMDDEALDPALADLYAGGSRRLSRGAG